VTIRPEMSGTPITDQPGPEYTAPPTSFVAQGTYTPPPATPPPPTAPPTPTPGESMFDIFRNFFESAGIAYDSELQDLITAFMQDGFSPDQVDLLMPDIIQTNAFQTRFPGYTQRINNGYNALSIGEILKLEDAYHRILQASGLPAGFYDDPSDFGQWIANDVSPAEIEGRVRMAVDAAKSIDPTMRNIMAQFYGLSTGDVASYFLDQSRALPIIEHQYKTAGIASYAARAGLAVNDITRFEQLASDGVTMEQAALGYGTVKQLSDYVGNAAGVYGESYTVADAEADVFFNKNEKRRRIVGMEQATFGGSSRGQTGSAKRQSY
jgi:hypothetical protein